MLCKWCEIPKSGDIAEEVNKAGNEFILIRKRQ